MFFIVIAILPTVFGLICRELKFLRLESYFDNLPPNIFGALIVCSLFHHISKFESGPMIDSFIRVKKVFIIFVLPVTFNFAFLNAINYSIQSKYRVTYFFNAIHIFLMQFIFFCCLFWAECTCCFFIRIADRTPLEYTAKHLYPRKALIFLALFLIFSGVPPVFLDGINQSIILLSINTISIFVATWFLLFVIYRRTSKTPNEYPGREYII